jgi:hypothetical protein
MRTPRVSTTTVEMPAGRDVNSPSDQVGSSNAAQTAQRVQSWGRRPRIGWFSEPLSGGCCNPGCKSSTRSLVGWTLADALDHGSTAGPLESSTGRRLAVRGWLRWCRVALGWAVAWSSRMPCSASSAFRLP